MGMLGDIDRWTRPHHHLRRLMEAGALPGDSDEDRLWKAAMVLSATIMASLATVWTVTYALLGLWTSALIPLAYQVASAVSIVVFARTRRYRMFRATQLTLSLALPFLLQWSLGGFVASSAVCVWAFTCPLGALMFLGARRAVPWFVAFLALVVASALIDPLLDSRAADIPEALGIAFFAMNIIGVALTTYVTLLYFVRERERIRAELEDQKDRSDRLLLNVLPAAVADRLKDRDGTIADDMAEVTVLFADIVDFSPLAERLTAAQLVRVLDRVFGAWDALAAHHGVEKIKTIGDSYMVAAGAPVARDDHAEAVADLALGMIPAIRTCGADLDLELDLDVRVGIATGPVVAGVIGRSRFSYDLWGDTVNTASRMESHALPGTIQVTERTHDRLRDGYALRERGTIPVKGKGPMRVFILEGRLAPEGPEAAPVAVPGATGSGSGSPTGPASAGGPARRRA